MAMTTVSVLMMVHQHEEFVAQAIEGVLSQQCDFKFELIVINDCSSDNSGEICHSYAKQHPDVIKLIDNRSNIGMHNSFELLWNTSTSDLVAFCEGDDYWVDELKLQKQVTLMTANPHWSLCGGRAQVIELSGNDDWLTTGYLYPIVKKNEYSFEELIKSYSFHFSTVIVRRSSVTFPDWFKTVYCVDRPIYLLAAENGIAGYLNTTLSTYRIHSGGNWSSISNARKAEQSIDLFSKLQTHFDQSYKPLFEMTLFNILQTYVAGAMLAQQYGSARQIFWSAFSGLGFYNKLKCLVKYYRTAILLTIKR